MSHIRDLVFCQEVLMSARALDAPVVKKAIEIQPEPAFRILIKNPHLTGEARQCLLEESLQILLVMAKNQERGYGVFLPASLAAYQEGYKDQSSPETEEILRLLRNELLATLPDESSELLAEKENLKEHYRLDLSRLLLHCNALSAELLLELAEYVMPSLRLGKLGQPHLEMLLRHPSASLELYRKMVSLSADITTESAICAKSSLARRDPEIRKRLKRHAMEGSVDALEVYLLDTEGRETSELFQKLSEQRPEAAARVFAHPEFRGFAYLTREEMAPLLASENPETRLAAIRKSSLLCSRTKSLS